MGTSCRDEKKYDGDAAADVLVLLNMIIISHIYGAIPTFSNE